MSSMDYVNYGILGLLYSNYKPIMVDRLKMISKIAVVTLKKYGNLLMSLDKCLKIMCALYKEERGSKERSIHHVIYLKAIRTKDFKVRILRRGNYKKAEALFKDYMKELCGFDITWKVFPAIDEECADCVILERVLN